MSGPAWLSALSPPTPWPSAHCLCLFASVELFQKKKMPCHFPHKCFRSSNSLRGIARKTKSKSLVSNAQSRTRKISPFKINEADWERPLQSAREGHWSRGEPWPMGGSEPSLLCGLHEKAGPSSLDCVCRGCPWGQRLPPPRLCVPVISHSTVESMALQDQESPGPKA